MPVRWWTALAPWAIAVCLQPADVNAGTAEEGYAHFHRALAAAYDDPRAALAEASRGAADAPGAAQRFWYQLAMGRIHGLLEQPDAARSALRTAEASLAADPQAPALARRMLRLQQLQAATLTDEAATLVAPLAALAREVAPDGPRHFACTVDQLRQWVMLESGALDEAWRLGEAQERCGRELQDADLQVEAAIQLGALASLATWRSQPGRTALDHFQRALALLGDRPARYLRSIVEWELGKALGETRPADALAHHERARALSESIGDDVGVAVASVSAAQLATREGQHARALELVRDARERYLRNGAHQRVLATYSIAVRAMTQMRHGGLMAELRAGRAWDLPVAPMSERANFARSAAAAMALHGEHRQAYDELLRAVGLENEARKQGANQALLRLQAAYSTAQRDAENATLKLREESARLELEAGRARQAALALALVALAVALVCGAVYAARIWRQRRQMADLALRDELTGAPNRRAIVAIAEAEWQHCRRLGSSLSLALLDLDHFKRVNDCHGHDAGDAALRAFARAARQALRAQDRIGRYGGEEWLLVAPGADPGQLEEAFTRLRAAFAATPIDGLPRPHGLSFSMGVALDDGTVGDLAALITRADESLYRAKAEGRDRLCVAPAAPQPEPAGLALTRSAA